jgi:hypothetical protein
MSHEALAITHTLGARLMAIQAGLIAEQTRSRPAAVRDHAFDRLMRGPDAQLLYSTWTLEQRREFQTFMQGLCAGLDQKYTTQ